MTTRLLDTPAGRGLLESMTFRCIGPPRGGRVIAVAGDPSDPAVFYFGAVAGGVWKTEDAGTTWRNVSDGFFKTSSVGALAVSDSDPSVIYAGMGEATIRIDISHGDGIYKSTDGGATWTHCGLDDTRHIGEIKIHPKDPDRVYVAAFGHAFGPNDERGVYRTTDGGVTWERVLHVGDRAGAIDIAFDPRMPDVIYATTWEAHRTFWSLSSGGPGSGIWKSTDGGDTWTEITRATGLPQTGLIGKVGVAASPVRAGRVWALVESTEAPGLYRSDDFGTTWRLLSDKPELRRRPWYYMHVFADTEDADTVWINNLAMWKSTDGGSTFERIGTPHGDNHDLWIDPRDHRRMVQGNDGGANVSFNAGESWSTIFNQLTAQFYTVTTDTREPFYHVYGTQQDNSSVAVPSRTRADAITWSDCYPAGTGESGFMAVHPDDPDIVYVGAVGSSPGGTGALQRYDHRSGQIRLINVWPEMFDGIGPVDLTYRFPWTFPILFSPHDSGVLYTAGNVVFRSTDEGHSWEAISPDLTRNDPEKLAVSGGPITKDTSGAEHYCTISTLRESDHEPGVFWAGSDDGLVHLSRDGGATWDDVTPPDLPEWAFIRTVEPSPHDPATLYLAATRYKHDDPAPYLYRTTDYGQTWESITGEGDHALPGDEIVRVVRADPTRAGLLYLGTETGLYVSMDDGATWDRWESNLPVTPVYDLTVKRTDLVIATHGRSFWVLDDLSPLYQVDGDGSDSQLFAPSPAWRVLPELFDQWVSTEGKDYWVGSLKAATFVAEKTETGHIKRTILDAGQSAPLGVTLRYHLGADWDPEADGAEVSLAFFDAAGDLVRAFGAKPAGYDELDDDAKALDPGPWVGSKPGANEFMWDLRYSGASRVAGNKRAGEANQGPLVLPGTYRAELRFTAADGSQRTLEQSFEVVNDPRSDADEAALREQRDLLLEIRDTISSAHEAVARIRDVRSQVAAWRTRFEDDEIVAAATKLESGLDEIESELIVPGPNNDFAGDNEPARLNEKLASVISVIGSADAAPTTQARAVADAYRTEIEGHLARLEPLLGKELDTFNALVKAADAPPVG
jgi:photosystem II stability/assembly factor-like uncharacterized protein